MKLVPVPYTDRLKEHIDATVPRALQDDLGSTGDISAELLPEDLVVQARIVARGSGILCGQAWAQAAFHTLDRKIRIDWRSDDGDALRPDRVVADIEGPARALLAADRVALNYLRTLSGTATRARAYADQADRFGLTLLDTRKTLPGLQLPQKYAVYVGGCHNHRLGAFDAYVLKRAHIQLLGGVSAAVSAARAARSSQLLMVEVSSYDDFLAAVEGGADRIILAPMDESELARIRSDAAPDLMLEAPGSQSPDELGRGEVPILSLAALTESVQAVPFELAVLTD